MLGCRGVTDDIEQEILHMEKDGLSISNFCEFYEGTYFMIDEQFPKQAQVLTIQLSSVQKSITKSESLTGDWAPSTSQIV